MSSPSWSDAVENDQPRSVCHSGSHIDEHIIALLDNENTRYIPKSDAGEYHKVGRILYWTDQFLSSVYAEFINPDTKGAVGRVAERLRLTCGLM